VGIVTLVTESGEARQQLATQAAAEVIVVHNGSNIPDETLIAVSREKVLLLILAACVFVAVGVWLFSLDAETIQAQRRFNNPPVVHGLGLASAILFGLAGLYAARKLFDTKPGLVFSPAGILDNSSAVAAGLIPWSEVVGVETIEIQRQKLLVIKVRDPERYIERGSVLKRALNRVNHRMIGSPIAISSGALRISFAELLSLFKRYQEKFGTVAALHLSAPAR
jgi:hypothetical protein